MPHFEIEISEIPQEKSSNYTAMPQTPMSPSRLFQAPNKVPLFLAVFTVGFEILASRTDWNPDLTFNL